MREWHSNWRSAARDLAELESESLDVISQVHREFRNPMILFSGGKDSTVLVHLFRLFFRLAKIPFPLVYIETGHSFPEVIQFRDDLARKFATTLKVGSVPDAIQQGWLKDVPAGASRNRLQSVVLLRVIQELRADVAVGGARRDEDRARAKERFFSHRDSLGGWKPENQNPEPWNYFLNFTENSAEHYRVFPLNNWTEADIWKYIWLEKLDVPSLYYSHERECFLRDGLWYADGPLWIRAPQEKLVRMQVRFRTVGDISCSTAIESLAKTPEGILSETEGLALSERAGRADDKTSRYAMEERKRQGYF
jgi:sulfate adenylyltransferase subunit 2